VTKLLVRNLERFGSLTEEDKHVLAGAATVEKQFAADQDIVREGDRPTICNVIVEGFLCRYRILPDGKRQIMNFLVPGDITDIQAFLLRTMDHSIGTLTPCTVAIIPHVSLSAITDSHPRIARALWQCTMVESALFRAWMVNIGQQEAYGRISHLLCELLLRMKVIGLAENGAYELPITQAELGDALGISNVHVNRVLQELRADGLITLTGRIVAINDWKGLREAGQFNPGYLHLRGAAGEQGISA